MILPKRSRTIEEIDDYVCDQIEHVVRWRPEDKNLLETLEDILAYIREEVYVPKEK